MVVWGTFEVYGAGGISMRRSVHILLVSLALTALSAATPAHAGPDVRAAPVGPVTAENIGDPERLPVPGYIVPSRKYVPPADQRAHKDKRRWARPPAATRPAPAAPDTRTGAETGADR